VRRLRPWFAALLLLWASACQVTLTTGIDVNRDGSGTVQAGIGLDDEGLRELGDPARELRLDDLRQAGWTVAGPAEEKDGLTWVRISKPFARPSEANRVAAELSSPDGPFRDFGIERDRSFFKTRTRFTGRVDLSNGLAGLSDPGLQAALEGADLGIDLAGLRRRFGDGLADTVRVRIEVRLPGRSQSWEPQMGEVLELEAQGESWNLEAVAGASAAVVFAVTALVVVVGRRR
jgi:hypothetical protein